MLQDKFSDTILLEKDDVRNIDKIKQKHDIKKIDLIIS